MSACNFCTLFLYELLLFTAIYFLLIFCKHKNCQFSILFPMCGSAILFLLDCFYIWKILSQETAGNVSNLAPIATILSALMATCMVMLSINWTYNKNRQLHKEKTTADLNIKCFADLSALEQRRKFLDAIDANGTNGLEKIFDIQRHHRTEKQRDTVHNITNMLNTWELISVSIDHDIADEDMLRNLVGSRLIRDWELMQSLISHMRKTQPEVYTSTERLFKKWSDKNNQLK